MCNGREEFVEPMTSGGYDIRPIRALLVVQWNAHGARFVVSGGLGRNRRLNSFISAETNNKRPLCGACWKYWPTLNKRYRFELRTNRLFGLNAWEGKRKRKNLHSWTAKRVEASYIIKIVLG